MPGFDRHQKVAQASGLIFASFVYLLSADVLGREPAMLAGVMVFAGCAVGGSLPDIDSPTSIPYRILVALLPVPVLAYFVFNPGIIAGLLSGIQNLSQLVGIVVVAVAGLFALSKLELHMILPQHRGPLHNIFVWAIPLSTLAFIIDTGLLHLNVLPPIMADFGVPVFLIAVIIGVAIHLVMDDEFH